MLISDHLNIECICVDLKGETKEDILKELAELNFKAHPDIDRDETLASLFEREQVLSTGIGEGIAIPHARASSCSEIFVSFGILRREVDFNALDNKPVRIVFLILFPKDQVNLQLRFLARVSRLLQHTSLHDDLYKCESPEEVINTFRKYEEKHFH
ncbi:PTS sugar transporter subunit IIA [bacterium]|nr:PTS sugar transporter subunit IIA [bacterium]